MRNKLHTERLEICITPKIKNALKKIAEKEGVTINEFVRRTLIYRVETYNK